jgi:hypothetical protein
MKPPDDAGARSEPLEGELIEPAVPAATRPPGRKPVAPLHLIAPLTAEEISMLTGDPNEVIRRRTADYLNWAHALVSTSPSRLNRVAFGVESQRRMVDKLLSLAIPPARQAGDPLGESRRSTDEELLEILRSLGPDPGFTNRQLPRATQARESPPEHEDLRPQ